MRIVVFFAQNFCEWPAEIIRIMANKNPDLEIIGLAVDEGVQKRISKHKDLPIRALYNLDEYEKRWVSEGVSDEDFEALEQRLGGDVVSKTVIADKNLASGWVDGAVIYDTPLAALTRDQKRLKAYVYGAYSFFDKIYKEHNPDLAFIYTIASGMTYAIGAAAHHHGFPFLRFQHSRIQKYFVLDTTLDGLLEPVQVALSKAKKDKSYLAEYYEPAREVFQGYHQQSRDTSNLAVNKKMYSKAMQWPSMLRATAGILYRAFKKQLSKGDIPLRERPERMNFMFKVSSAFTRRYLDADNHAESFASHKDTPYVYFALHVDPEASTLICAPYHANQTAVIEVLSKSMPLSSKLLVKEHPIMIGKRPRGFYKKIANMPNVILINHDESSHDLIKNAALVATITGTVGWEAMAMQKPLLLMGRTPYMEIDEGFVFCQDPAKLHDAITEGLKTEPARDEALIEYIAAVMKAGMHVPDELLWNYSHEAFEEHIEVANNLADYLLNYPRNTKMKKSA